MGSFGSEVKANGSVEGSDLVCAMYSPVFRCHQRSGSQIFPLKTAKIKKKIVTNRINFDILTNISLFIANGCLKQDNRDWHYSAVLVISQQKLFSPV